MQEHEEDGWVEWRRYVLKELERLGDCLERLDKKFSGIREDVVMLKVKSGIWGVIGGVIVLGCGALVWFIF